MVEAISRAREELAEMWTQDRVLRNAEERVAGAEALIKELKAEVAATSTSQRGTYDQYRRYFRE